MEEKGKKLDERNLLTNRVSYAPNYKLSMVVVMPKVKVMPTFVMRFL